MTNIIINEISVSPKQVLASNGFVYTQNIAVVILPADEIRMIFDMTPCHDKYD